ncbi:hypothetical protein O6H91_01G170700 [Diphasiastrum complanatum]|uniref:Uncharacterized protein n=1 Tax=Diphasiastrum complanatum TaxID=34168 RepID=A0ACC2EYU5_DIPCM|nr:hypothetical protein O6H91_01G170700 [Diphasiastrum complanatum]
MNYWQNISYYPNDSNHLKRRADSATISVKILTNLVIESEDLYVAIQVTIEGQKLIIGKDDKPIIEDAPEAQTHALQQEAQPMQTKQQTQSFSEAGSTHGKRQALPRTPRRRRHGTTPQINKSRARALARTNFKT